MQDTQREQKVGLDQLSRQMSQLATSMSEMRGNDGKIPSQVQNPHRANVSQVTLRSGRELKGPEVMGTDRGKTVESGELGSPPDQYEEKWEDDLEQQVMEEPFPLPKGSDPLNQFQPGSSSGIKDKEKSILPSKEVKEKRMKVSNPYPGRLVKKKLKEEAMDFKSIFGKLEIN